MNLAYHLLLLPPIFHPNPRINLRINNHKSLPKFTILNAQKRCLRCNTLYEDTDNSPTACSFHGPTTVSSNLLCLATGIHMLPELNVRIKQRQRVVITILNSCFHKYIIVMICRGEGLFAFASPHQGIDGEWSDKSGVIVHKWNEKDKRPNTGRSNWKRRWSCCTEYDENAECPILPTRMAHLV